jgi:hypothetical protein
VAHHVLHRNSAITAALLVTQNSHSAQPLHCGVPNEVDLLVRPRINLTAAGFDIRLGYLQSDDREGF